MNFSSKKAASLRRILLILGVVGLFAIGGCWIGNRWIGGKIESTLVSKLKDAGFDLSWEQSLWDPWRGLHLKGLNLRSRGSAPVPIIELGSLDLKLPLGQFISGGETVSFWQTNRSTLTLHDEVGAVTLEKVGFRMKAGPGKLQIESLTLDQAGTAAKLTGNVILSTDPRKSSEPFRIQLDALRATLATLDVRGGTGPLHVTGSFTVDASKPALTWSTKLNGQGKDLEWKGVRWASATAQAEISSEGSKIGYELSSAHGSIRGTASRADGGDAPFIFEGSLTDSNGRSDDWRATYQKKIFTVESLKGRADLWSLAADIPALADKRSDKIRFKTFPEIHLRGAVRNPAEKGSEWIIRSLSIESADKVVFSAGDHDLEAEKVSASGSFDGRDWTISESSANLLGGTVSLKGRYSEGVLRQGNFEADGIRMNELRSLLGKEGGKGGKSILSVRYHGSVDLSRKSLDGAGSMRLENAPIVEVPLLDQVYEIFSALLPGVERSKDGEFNAEFKADEETIDVSRFEAKGGSSLTVSAVGTIDLKKGRVSGRARGKLVGLPGLVTSPLSRLLEMDVNGPYNDIRVKPLGPAKLASNTVSGTVGVAVDTLEETGKITGTILKEGIKVPFSWLSRDKAAEDKPDH